MYNFLSCLVWLVLISIFFSDLNMALMAAEVAPIMRCCSALFAYGFIIMARRDGGSKLSAEILQKCICY